MSACEGRKIYQHDELNQLNGPVSQHLFNTSPSFSLLSLLVSLFDLRWLCVVVGFTRRGWILSPSFRVNSLPFDESPFRHSQIHSNQSKSSSNNNKLINTVTKEVKILPQCVDALLISSSVRCTLSVIKLSGWLLPTNSNFTLDHCEVKVGWRCWSISTLQTISVCVIRITIAKSSAGSDSIELILIDYWNSIGTTVSWSTARKNEWNSLDGLRAWKETLEQLDFIIT